MQTGGGGVTPKTRVPQTESIVPAQMRPSARDDSPQMGRPKIVPDLDLEIMCFGLIAKEWNDPPRSGMLLTIQRVATSALATTSINRIRKRSGITHDLSQRAPVSSRVIAVLSKTGVLVGPLGPFQHCLCDFEKFLDVEGFRE